MELVREGKTARVTRKTPPTDHGNTPIRFNMSRGLSIVVRSLSISTVASAGIRTADSFGVIRLRYRNTTRVIAVRTPEQAKNIPAAMELEDAVVTDMIDAIGGAIPERPCPVIIACV